MPVVSVLAFRKEESGSGSLSESVSKVYEMRFGHEKLDVYCLAIEQGKRGYAVHEAPALYTTRTDADSDPDTDVSGVLRGDA